MPDQPEVDHTIPTLPNRDDRLRIDAGPQGLRIEIRPLVRTWGGRARVAACATLLLAAALFGAARLGQAWESGLTRGTFDLPWPLLAALSISVGVSTPLAVLGLAALAFAEETVEVGPRTVTIRTSAFERTRVRSFELEALECWRETYLPLPPWWTWAVKRLAARCDGRLEPLAAAAGPREKKAIALALSRATGKPIVRDWGNEPG